VNDPGSVSPRRIGRIPVADVAPVVDGGTRPVKSVVDEQFDVTATVFREGHEAVNATVVVTDPAGREHRQQMIRVKPVEFWEWLIDDVARDHPEIIWLAEAFTRPPMMHNLAKVGFQQSYTYYAWRHAREEIQDYLRELAGPAAAYMRPNFWPTTHDILTPFMQHGGPAAWKMRAALAATLTPSYGIYAGYELREQVARPGAEEQIHNEKYEFKNHRWEDYQPGGPRAGQSLAPYLKTVNEIRRAHPALRWLRNLRFHRADDENVLVFSKARRIYDRDDVIVVVANLNPVYTRDTWIHLIMPELGFDGHDRFVAHDLITGQYWNWAEHTFVRVGPDTEPVHIVHVQPY
jgi:starch synthase (maltosyl-transferring)